MTKADLRQRIAEYLGIWDGDQLSAGDAEVIDKAIDAAHEELLRTNAITWTTADIPDYASDPLRAYIGASCRSDFFPEKADPLAIRAEQDIAETRLRKLTSRKSTTPITAEYF